SRSPRTRVDVHPVPFDLRMSHRGVAMNDVFSMVRGGVKEFTTYPEQVVEVLPIDRNAGTNSGMHEQKIAAAEAVAQALQEHFVRAREDVPKAAMGVDFRVGTGTEINAVRCKGLHAAQLEPGAKVEW